MTLPARTRDVPGLGRVCRLGLATRGNTSLDRESVLASLERGVNYWNWCGHSDGMMEAIRTLGFRRSEVRVAVQMSARTASAAERELREFLGELGTDYLDVVTYYYVEHRDEWDEIVGNDGAASFLEGARARGVVRLIGVTSHQRKLAASIAESGRVDLLMVRYNAAHRGAEAEVFPVTNRLGLPVVAFTCLRWGVLLEPTPDDPPDFEPPDASAWYRYVLANPSVSVALMAPDGSAELDENLRMLEDWQVLSQEELDELEAHGDRVHRNSGTFW